MYCAHLSQTVNSHTNGTLCRVIKLFFCVLPESFSLCGRSTQPSAPLHSTGSKFGHRSVTAVLSSVENKKQLALCLNGWGTKLASIRKQRFYLTLACPQSVCVHTSILSQQTAMAIRRQVCRSALYIDPYIVLLVDNANHLQSFITFTCCYDLKKTWGTTISDWFNNLLFSKLNVFMFSCDKKILKIFLNIRVYLRCHMKVRVLFFFS